MNEGFQYADIVILALIAGFILLRLRSVLGQKTGHDNPGYFNRAQAPKTPEPVVHVHEASLKPKPKEEADAYMATISDPAIAETLAAIKTRDPLFTATSFLLGARMAFEMVFDAFAKGDKATLKQLLSDALYQQFVAEIDARGKEANKTETTLVSVEAKDIVQASLDKNTARLSVRFLSEQIALVRDREGKVIEGDPSDIHHVEDEWVLERDITSKNPNWKIIET